MENKEEQIILIADKKFNCYTLIIFIAQFIVGIILGVVKSNWLIPLVFLIELLLLVIERTYSKRRLSVKKKAQRDANFVWLTVLIEIGIIFLLNRENESTWLLLTKFIFIIQIIFVLWGGLGIYLYQGIKKSKE